MIEFLQSKLICILAILLLISVGANTYFIMGHGVIVNRNTTNNNHSEANSYSNSSSASIGININGTNDYSYGKKAAYKTKSFSSLDDALVFVNGLSEGQLYNKQVLVVGTNFYLIYRDMNDTVQTGAVTKTSVNGAEVPTNK